MKKLLFLAIAAAILSACGTPKTAGERQAHNDRVEAQIADSIDAGTITVFFNYVNPLRMRPHYLTSDYSVTIHGDTIESYLPYFGRTYRSDYGSTSSPLSFTSRIEAVNVSQGRKGDYLVEFSTINNTEQLFFSLRIFPNGNASLFVNSNYRESISFDGKMEFGE